MPTVKVDYELTTGAADPHLSIDEIIFDAVDTARANLARDRVVAPAPGYKSQNPPPPSPPNPEPYWVFPNNQFVRVFVRATGTNGFGFSMTVTFTVVDDNTFEPVPNRDPFTPANPVLAATIVDGQAAIDTSVRWRKPS